MLPESAVGIVVLFIAIAFICRVFADGFDEKRVEAYIKSIGGELIDKSWAPFGPGWFGEKDSRIYEIIYRDRDGRLHRAHVKTSMLSGVYLSNDHLVQDLPQAAIEDEKARLKKRLAELENQ